MTRQKAIDILSLLLADHNSEPIYSSLINPKDLAAALQLAIKAVRGAR